MTIGVDKVLENSRIIEWVKKIDAKSKWTVSDCSGSLVLAQAGLLNGKSAVTHWGRKKQLEKYGCLFKNERYVHEGKIITAAGVSAGIDMALYLVSKIAGDQVAQIIQLAIEYDPKPPFDCGSPGKAPKEIIESLKVETGK